MPSLSYIGFVCSIAGGVGATGRGSPSGRSTARARDWSRLPGRRAPPFLSVCSPPPSLQRASILPFRSVRFPIDSPTLDARPVQLLWTWGARGGPRARGRLRARLALIAHSTHVPSCPARLHRCIMFFHTDTQFISYYSIHFILKLIYIYVRGACTVCHFIYRPL